MFAFDKQKSQSSYTPYGDMGFADPNYGYTNRCLAFVILSSFGLLNMMNFNLSCVFA